MSSKRPALTSRSEATSRWRAQVVAVLALLLGLHPVALARAGLTLVVDAPASATVLLDGRPVSIGPCRLEGIAPGLHSLEVVVRGEVVSTRPVISPRSMTVVNEYRLDERRKVMGTREEPGRARVPSLGKRRQDLEVPR